VEDRRGLFTQRGGQLEVVDAVPRREMMRIPHEVDGLLLPSASLAAIPSKLFEYLPTGKPILAVTKGGSAIWRIGERVPQIYLVDTATSVDSSMVQWFLSTCQNGLARDERPREFGESHLSELFVHHLFGGNGN
jgi:hypothetical protein